MEEIKVIFTNYPVNLCLVSEIYGANIHTSILKRSESSNQQRRNINEVLFMFSNYWKANYIEIRKNLDNLIVLTTMFVDEPYFVEEYDQVCSAMKTYISEKQYVCPEWQQYDSMLLE